MSRELLTSWSDYQMALDRILVLTTENIAIYDEDLETLALEGRRLNYLLAVVNTGKVGALRIAVRNANPMQSRQPRLLALLSTYSHHAAAQQTPEHLAHLRESMVVVDNKHALIRFDRDQPRCKLILDDTEAVRPYLLRLDEIWREGGNPTTSHALGL